MSGLPDSYGLNLPPEWVDLPTEPAGFAKRVEEIRTQAREQPGWTRTGDRRIELLMRQLRSNLDSARVTFAASFLGLFDEVVEGEAPSVDDVFAAGCVISTLTRADLDTDAPLEAAVLLAAYTADRNDGPSDFVDLEPASVVRLREPGEAVRLVRLADLGTVDREPLKTFLETYLVPIAEGDAVCVLQFSTPNIEHASEASELFGAIAQTLRVFYEDTPTFDDEAVAAP